jgi:hypothetical protein
MSDLLPLCLVAAVLFNAAMHITYLRAKIRDETEALMVLLHMMADQKDKDANNIVFDLEKYASRNRKTINEIRIDYLKNNKNKLDTAKKKGNDPVFFEAAAILYERGAKRAAEFLEGAFEMKRNNLVRIMKVKNEIVNSVGVVLTMAMMFLIVIYFLAPYTDMFDIYIP